MALRRIYPIILFLACFATHLHAWTETPDDKTIVTLSLTDGLAGETVNRVITDHLGRIWIATNNGVNVFNGRKLETFNLADEHHKTVTVYDLCETGDKSIYAATEYGLYKLELGSYHFRHILPEITHPICLLADGNKVYIGGQQGFKIYDDGRLWSVNIGANLHGLDNIVRQYVKNEDGLIWFAGRYDINSYNPKTGEVVHHSLEDALPPNAAPSQFEIVGDDIFLGTIFQGLYVYNLKTGKTEKIEGVGNVVKTVRKSADGKICVATDGSGAFLIDPESKTITETYNMQGPHQLPTNAIYSFYRDSNGVNWFGFVRYGLAYTSHVGQLFKPYQVDDFTTLGRNVRTSCLHGDDCLIGSQNGFWYYNGKKNITKYFSPEEFGGGHIVNNILWFQGKYYIGTFDGGLRIFDPQRMILQRQQLVPQLDNTTIGDLKVSPDSNLWIGSGEGLFIISPEGQVKRFTDQNSHIQSGLILNITFGQRGKVWLTGATGISLFNMASGKVEDVAFPEDFFHHEPFLRGARGHDSLIYMRNGPQLFYTTEDISRYGEVPLPITLSDKWCRSMVDDMNGHLWLASEKGLFSFDYDMREMLHFGYGEGLQGYQISEVSQDEKGMIWVGTSEGLFYMNPADLDDWRNNRQYGISLYNIRRGSDLLPLTETLMVNEDKKITLTWHFGSEVLQAEAVLMDYARQGGRLYEYRLDGKDWQMVQDGEPIYIHGLWMGKHTLTVRLVGMDGTMSSYTIAVVPSVATIVELLMLAALLAFLFFANRFRKNTKVLLSERNEIEDALIEVEKELNQVMGGDETLGEPVAMENGKSQTKYQKVKIDRQECEDIVREMRKYLEEGKVYTDADLKMKNIADVLHLSPSKLSQVFNLFLKENYYDFINRYRLEEFKRLLDAGEHKRYTITALSEKCGFKRSNFFSTFRKVEGMTPVEYLKKKGIKV